MSVVSEAYPNVRIVEGDLDDIELVEREARDADVVLRRSACVFRQAYLNGIRSCQHQA